MEIALVGLGGVVIGAGLSFLFTMYIERLKWKREAEAKRHEKSVSASQRALLAIRTSNIRTGRGEPEDVKAACPALHAALEAEVPFIAHEDVAERVNACQEAARVFGWDESQFKGYNHALASIRIRQIVTQTRWTLEAYIAGRRLPDWPDLPNRVSAMSWVFGPRDDRRGG